MRLTCLAVLLGCFCIGTASGNIIVNAVGTPGSSIITLSATGTFFAESSPDDDIGIGAGWSGDFAGPVFDNGAGLVASSRADLIAGDLTASFNGIDYELSIGFDDDGVGTNDDFGFFRTNGLDLPFSLGDVWTLSGKSSFDLTTLGNLPVGAMPTFDDLNVGSYTSILAGGSGITLNISAAAVPEPGSLLIWTALGAVGISGTRRKRFRS